MNLTNLEYFLVTTEEMNITKAADRLHISQQALSNHIRHLEEELGAELFIRKPSLMLTYAGKCLINAAGQMIDIRRQLNNQIDDITHNIRGELRIGISYSRGQAILPAILPAFIESHPFVEVSVIEKNSYELEEDLDKGMVDVVFGMTPFYRESIETRLVFHEHLYMVIPKKFIDERYGKEAEAMREHFKSGVLIEDFLDFPFILLKKGNRIRSIIEDMNASHKHEQNILLETENIQTAFLLSTAGLGISFYPEMFLLSKHMAPYDSDSIDYYPLQDERFIEELAIAYNKDRYVSRPLLDFVDLCTDNNVQLLSTMREHKTK